MVYLFKEIECNAKWGYFILKAKVDAIICISIPPLPTHTLTTNT